MDTQTLWNRRIALFGLRVMFGSVTMFVAYHKIFISSLAEQYKWFTGLEAYFPPPFLVGVNYYCAYVELICGFLILIGLFRDISLYLVLSVLVIVAFGHSLDRYVWDMAQVSFRTAMLLPLLLLPASWDIIRLDSFQTFLKEVRTLRKAPAA
jgi:uncharacterized membrane protein YphA (DoxX/SURF4 family)